MWEDLLWPEEYFYPEVFLPGVRLQDEKISRELQADIRLVLQVSVVLYLAYICRLL